MKARTLPKALTAATLALGLVVAPAFTTSAFAATTDKAPTPQSNCFLSQNWQDWRGASPDTIYLRVNVHDIWKIGLSGGTNMVTDPTNHLVNELRGSSWICNPLDLDLKISDGHGIIVPLFVKSLTRLTPEQVAAIPKKDLP